MECLEWKLSRRALKKEVKTPSAKNRSADLMACHLCSSLSQTLHKDTPKPLSPKQSHQRCSWPQFARGLPFLSLIHSWVQPCDISLPRPSFCGSTTLSSGSPCLLLPECDWATDSPVGAAVEAGMGKSSLPLMRHPNLCLLPALPPPEDQMPPFPRHRNYQERIPIFSWQY